MKAIPKAIAILSTLGIINSAYLTYLFIRSSTGGGVGPTFCDINSTLSCSNVITSPYAQLFGVPICTIALLIYPALLILALLAHNSKTPRNLFFALAILSAMGMMMNVIYVYNEVTYIGALCVLCIGCGIIITTNLILSIIGYSLSNSHIPPTKTLITKVTLPIKKTRTTKKVIALNGRKKKTIK